MMRHARHRHQASPRRVTALAVLLATLTYVGSVIPSARAQPAWEPGPEAVFQVSVSGGPDAGSYEVEQMDSSCLYGTGTGDDWRNLYAEPDSLPLSTVTLQVTSTTEAAAGSDDFVFVVGLGAYGGDAYHELVIDPLSAKGSGEVTITREGRNHAVVTIRGTTADGQGLEATITCNDVVAIASDVLAGADIGPLTLPPSASAEATGSIDLTIGPDVYTLATTDAMATCGHLVDDGDVYYGLDAGGGTNSVQVFVPVLENAFAGTDEFGLGIDLQAVYRTGDAGTGTLTAARDGDMLVLSLSVTTIDGMPIEATVKCRAP